MKDQIRISDGTTVNVIVFSVSVVAFIILFALLVFFLKNQATLIGQFEEAVGLYKAALRARSADGAAIPADDISLLWNEKIKYLEQLNTMHKQVSTTDLFVFMYGFLSSVLIGISAYLLKKSEFQQKKVSDKYNELKKTADELEQKISDGYIKLKENTDKLEQKDSNNDQFFLVSQILSDAIADISTYKHTPENEYLVQFRQEVREIADRINDIKLDEIDPKIIDRFERRFGTIRGLYKDTSKDPKKMITENHKKSVQKDFDRIKSKLDEIQSKN